MSDSDTDTDDNTGADSESIDDADSEGAPNQLMAQLTAHCRALTACVSGMTTKMGEIAAASPLSSLPISWSAFGRGMGANTAIFLLLFGWAWFQSDKISLNHQARLASKTAVIEHQKEKPAAVERLVYETESIAIDPSGHIERGENSLIAAPVPGLYESLPFGVLPKKRQSDNITPFDSYKRPFTPVPGKPIIAIAIFDLGLSVKATQSAIKVMPEDISLIFTPYAKGLDTFRQKARAAGHEIWMGLPMENKTYPKDDPGSQAVLVSSSLQRNQDRILWGLSRTVGYAGVVSGRKHKFQNQHLDGHPLMEQVLGRGLGFIESNPENIDFGATVAKEYGAPYAQNDIWIDDPLTAETIVAQLRKLEEKAHKEGQAIGFIRPYPISYQIILKWSQTLKKKGIQLAPLSAVTQK